MSLIRCPICNEMFDAEQSQSTPFCSERCRRIDLSRWLDERYVLPIEREEEPDPKHPSSPDEC